MNEKHIVEPGKIITIIFQGPYKRRPLNIAIKNNKTEKCKGAVYISPLAPLARAILNRKTGEIVEFNSSEGKLGVRILGISS